MPILQSASGKAVGASFPAMGWRDQALPVMCAAVPKEGFGKGSRMNMNALS